MLELYLSEKRMVWALAHPIAKTYIHQNSGVGYQKDTLIITEDSQPAKIDLQDYPEWARIMIKNAIKKGDLINRGKKIEESKKKIASASIKEKGSTTSRKKTKKKNKK